MRVFITESLVSAIIELILSIIAPMFFCMVLVSATGQSPGVLGAGAVWA
jgi:hypothetical protein